MFGGVGKSAGWATILGTVGFVLSGSVSAKAADLGGDCCADLEERVAELEATTARKGNRKVSLTVSGWVNEAIFGWDDGTEQNVYVGTNALEQSRFRFTGSAKIDKCPALRVPCPVRFLRSEINTDSDPLPLAYSPEAGLRI